MSTTIATFNPVVPSTLTFKNKALEKEARFIAQVGTDMRLRNVELAKSLGRILESKCYAEDGYKSVDDFAAQVFGMSKAQAYALANVGRRFYNSESEIAQQAAQLFTPSNLAELVTLTDYELAKAMNSGAVNQNSKQAEIREAAKAIKEARADDSADSAKPAKVLKQFMIRAISIEGASIVQIPERKASIEEFSAYMAERWETSDIIDKKLTDTARIFYNPNKGQFAKVIVTPVLKDSKRKNGPIKTYTREQLLAMLKALEDDKQ